MGVSVQSTVEPRTFSNVVDRLMAACGDTRPGTVVGPSDRAKLAMEAANEAVDRVYNKARWLFRFKWARIDLVEDTMWYDLPDDFDQPATNISSYSEEVTIKYLEWSQLLEKYPKLRAFDSTFASDAIAIGQQALLTEYFGTPTLFTLTSESVGLFKIPNEAFVDANTYLYWSYYRNPVEMVADNDVLDLPKQFWLAHFYIALGKYKQNLEYDDYVADEQRGEGYLNDLAASDYLLVARNQKDQIDANYNE